MNFKTLKEEARREFKEFVDEEGGASEVSDSAADDRIHEIADEAPPAYHGHLLDHCEDDMWFCTYAPELGYDRSGDDRNASKLVQLNIYEAIREDLATYWQELQMAAD